MSQSLTRICSGKMRLEEQFRYLRRLTEEDFQIQDVAEHRRHERDIEIGIRSRESVEREWAERARNKVRTDALRKHEIEGDHALENLVDMAICRSCGGLTDAVVWSTRIETRLCECPTSSEDEAALPSPPQTPSLPEDHHEKFDGKLDVGRRQWLKERSLMELRGPYRPEFEDYTCWREARVRFFQTSMEPAIDTVRPSLFIKMPTDCYEPIKSRIRRLERLTRSQSSIKEFFELNSYGHPQIIGGTASKSLESGSKCNQSRGDSKYRQKCRSANSSSRVSKAYKKSPRKRSANPPRSIGRVSDRPYQVEGAVSFEQ